MVPGLGTSRPDRDSQVRVIVFDKLARKQYEVEPRQFEGRLLHQLPRFATPTGTHMRSCILQKPDESRGSR